MSKSSFENLCAALCDAISAGRGSASEMVLKVDGVRVTVQADDTPAPANARLRVTFGPLPPENPLSACQALMEMNSLMLWSPECSFARNPSTGEIVLNYAYPIDQATASDLYATVVELADVARSWRQHWFLSPSGASPIGPLVAAAGQMS